MVDEFGVGIGEEYVHGTSQSSTLTRNVLRGAAVALTITHLPVNAPARSVARTPYTQDARSLDGYSMRAGNSLRGFQPWGAAQWIDVEHGDETVDEVAVNYQYVSNACEEAQKIETCGLTKEQLETLLCLTTSAPITLGIEFGE